MLTRKREECKALFGECSMSDIRIKNRKMGVDNWEHGCYTSKCSDKDLGV